MDTQQFLAEFGHIANSPRGVSRLRELILALAMQGRLVERNPTESDVNNNLKVIEQLKLRLVEAKKMPRQKFIPELNKSEIPHPIPQHWTWVRFGNIAQHNTGKTLDKSKNTGVRRDYITTSNLYWGKFDLQGVKQVPIEEKELEKCTAIKGDLLICEGGEAGRAAVWEYDYNICFQNHVHRARFYDYVDPYFAFRLFQKISATGEINDFRKGIGISSMSGQALASIPFPLPPFEEQSRIVAKVDELMALCDQLDAQLQKRRILQNQLRQATLQAVAASQSPHELKESWQRLQTNFDKLFSLFEDVQALRSTVLDLAIAGYLSEESTEDEKVDDFIKRNESSKLARLNSGEMKRKKASSTDVYQLELETPGHWAKVALEDLFQFIDYRGKTPPKTESGVVLVTAKNVRPRRLNKEPIEYISEKSYREWMTRGFPRLGDLLFTTEAPLGNVARIEEEPTFALAQRVINFQPFADLNTKCAMYFMLSPIYQNLLDRNSTGMTAKGIKAAKLKQLELPIPPIQEQQRIVNCIERLFCVCDELESLLIRGGTVAKALAIASVSALTGIAIEQEEEPMKAPQTELVALVRLGTPPDVKAQAPLATILARHNGEMGAKDLWQRFGGDIDVFYAQLKTEVAHGWILEPKPAEMREKLDS